MLVASVEPCEHVSVRAGRPTVRDCLLEEGMVLPEALPDVAAKDCCCDCYKGLNLLSLWCSAAKSRCEDASAMLSGRERHCCQSIVAIRVFVASADDDRSTYIYI